MIKLNDILDTVKAYNSQADLDLIRKAYVYAAKAHSGQVRKSGEPYFSHPLEVAKILADMQLDVASICTGLLHDTIEDTPATSKEIEQYFGRDIRLLVEGVTKLSQVQFQSSEEKQAENFRKMLLAISKDIRVLLVKLADRLHNMRTLGHMSSDKQERIALETMEIYAPLANRLGIGWMKVELEDLSFKYYRNHDYLELKEKIGQTKKERKKFIGEVSSDIAAALKKSGMNDFEVFGRPKHLWSIYRKMVDKGLDFEDVHDLIAFRVLTNNLGQCYEVLGHIHAIWRPIPGRFKDYIAMPKPNGYRSLHTTLIGPKGERVEVQIRTHDMNDIAESGIAAHWKYKERNKPIDAQEASKDGFVWLRQLMDWQRDLKDPNEFLESVKVDLFADEVYVFTPNGEVIELPRGATPVDFAFSIHSDIGMQCVGAKVNDRLVPLKHILQNGDTCEILTQRYQKPRKHWLEFVKTSRARTRIRAILRQMERERSKEIGHELLEREFRKHGRSFQKELKNCSEETLFRDMRYKTIDEFTIAVGYGKLEPRAVYDRIIPDESLDKEDSSKSKLGQLIERVSKPSSAGIKIEGVNDILVNYAKCCAPLKGDPVIGFITRGRGLTIHRQNCPKILELDSERKIKVFWDSDAKFVRNVCIRVLSNNREGMLNDLSAVFSHMAINISEANCRAISEKRAINSFKCGIRDIKELNDVLRNLAAIKGVLSVERAQLYDE